MEPKYFDIHSHLQGAEFEHDLHEVVGRMRETGVHTIAVGVDYPSSEKAIVLADQFPEVCACVGLHPADDPTVTFDTAQFSAWAAHEKVVAIGECGLDYYRLPDGDTAEEKSRQRELFEAQIAFATEHDLPLMLHGRPKKGSMDAYEDMLSILEAHAPSQSTLRGNAHFFVGTIDIAKRFLAINFTVSFPGIITFTHEYDEVVKYVPLDMLHGETDSPYATPAPHRGKRNEPSLVIEVVRKIAQLKGHDEEEVRMALLANAVRTFNL